MDQETRQDASMPVTAPVKKRKKFLGSYSYKIDTKGRLIIPPAFRDGLGCDFVLSVDMEDNAIVIYNAEVFDELMLELQSANRNNRDVMARNNHISKYSYPEQNVDSQGRLLLQNNLRRYILEDETEVEVSGAIDHVRVVSAARAAEEDRLYRATKDERLDRLAGMN